MQPKRLPFWPCLLVLVLSACVSLKGRVPYDAVDYRDLRRQDLIAKLNTLQARLDSTEKSRRKCSLAYGALQRQFQELQAQNRSNALRIKALESELAEINFAFEILRKEQKPGG
jgi:chromosome segregation ATPase